LREGRGRGIIIMARLMERRQGNCLECLKTCTHWLAHGMIFE